MRIFKPRRGSTRTMTQTEKKNIVLSKGELFVEVPNDGAGTGPSIIKIGDGISKYEDLPVAISGTEECNVVESSTESAQESLDNVVSGQKISILLGELKNAISKNLTSIGKLNTNLPFKLEYHPNNTINDRYGYLRSEDNTFVPFRSQADIDRAAAAARIAAMKGTAVAADVLAGKTFTNNSAVELSGTMPNNGAWTPNKINPGGSITIPAGYHNGSGKVQANPNQNSSTYICPSNWNGSPSINSNGDMGINNAYRYVDASNVYIKGKNDGITSTKSGTASAAEVLSGYTFTNRSGVNISGTMPNKGAASQTLNCGEAFTIPLGYHNGSGKVTANSLASQTGVDSGKTAVTAATMVSGYQGWVNGNKITGTAEAVPATTYNTSDSDRTIAAGKYLSGAQTIKAVTTTNISAGNIKAGITVKVGDVNSAGRIKNITGTFTADGTASKDNILNDKIAYVNGSRIVGKMPNQGKKTASLNPGGSYTIPEGYHNGTGVITANSDSNLIAKNIKKGITIFGINGNYDPLVTAKASDITILDESFEHKKITLSYNVPHTGILRFKIETQRRDNEIAGTWGESFLVENESTYTKDGVSVVFNQTVKWVFDYRGSSNPDLSPSVHAKVIAFVLYE